MACYAWLAVAAVACGADEAADLQPLEIPPGCNPIAADADCLLPWPSDVFRVADDTLPSGGRVVHPDRALPEAVDGRPIDLYGVHPADGFSFAPTILAIFPEGLDDAELPRAGTDLTRTLGPDSPTQILEAATGRRILHLAELDPRAGSDARRALILRPLERLEPGQRYVVALQRLAYAGEPVAPPEGFRRIRDGRTEQDPQLDDLAEHYEDEIFPVIEAAGIGRGDLQLAWDFSVRSEANAMADMEAVREATLAYLVEAPPEVTITAANAGTDPRIARIVEGTVRVPLFVESDLPGATFVRGADGRPEVGGTAQVPFTIVVPQRAVDDGLPAPVAQFGHGFFGTRNEIVGDGRIALADATGLVLAAVDWWGLSDPDQAFIVADLMADPSRVLDFVDRLHQAMANQMVFARALAEVLPAQPELAIAGAPALDGTQVGFLGISLGHILGGTYVAQSPDIDRAALIVGGGPFGLVMTRSYPFRAFLDYIDEAVPDELDQQVFLAMLSAGLDRVDPITYAPHVVADPFDGMPASRQVLVQAGLGDTSVPPLAAEAHARALGIGLLDPPVRDVPGLERVTAPAASALVEQDLGVPPPYAEETATPAETPTAVHGDVPKSPPMMEQVRRFLRAGGEVEATCDGPCDPD